MCWFIGYFCPMNQRVFIDANTLYSRTLRDWTFLLRLNTNDMFQLHTSWDVITEAAARLRDKHPASNGALVTTLIERVQDVLDEIVTAYPGGPVEWIADEGDWHVHHAAVAAQADILLTEDQRFSSDKTPYEVLTCDEFFLEVATAAPHETKEVLQRQAEYWGKKPQSKQVPEALRLSGCEEFALWAEAELKKIALQR